MALINIKDLDAEVNKEIREEEMKEAKRLIKEKRKQISVAEKVVRQLKLEEEDIIARISKGV